MDDKLLKRRLNKHRPHTPQDALRKCGLTLKFIKEGAYREVFEIVGTQWVIKFPLTIWDTYKFGPEVDWLQRHREHSEMEISAYLKNRRRKKLKPFVPDLLWWHPGLGVIVMRKYRPVPSTEEYYNAMGNLTEALERYYDQDHDVRRENCGIDIMGNLKIVDMGLLREYEASPKRGASQGEEQVPVAALRNHVAAVQSDQRAPGLQVRDVQAG